MSEINQQPVEAVASGPIVREMPANELAIRAQRGCVTAFSELTNRYRPGLLRFLEKRHGGCMEDAEDIVQETLARAWKNIRRFDSKYRFSTWLYTLAVRISVDHQRRGRQSEETLRSSSPLIDSRESVEAATMRAEISENIWSVAQEALSETQFSALWLRYGEGMLTKDVARALGKTTISVRVLLHRSRNKLAPLMRVYVDDFTAAVGTTRLPPREEMR